MKFGLIGYPLGHSFSKNFYDEKIAREGISGVRYDLFPIQDIEGFPQLIQEQSDLMGVNVTIPHKVSVMPFLNEVSANAQKVGAVNCIRIVRSPQGGAPLLKGENTDVFGFQASLLPLLEDHHTRALVLGTGGASKAVCFALDNLKLSYTLVSRFPKEDSDELAYEELTEELISEHPLIVNTTPLGMFPDVDSCPPLPYMHIGPKHLLYDLVYNPERTAFLQKGASRGAKVKNGMEMLRLQAEKNWEIWTTP